MAVLKRLLEKFKKPKKKPDPKPVPVRDRTSEELFKQQMVRAAEEQVPLYKRKLVSRFRMPSLGSWNTLPKCERCGQPLRPSGGWQRMCKVCRAVKRHRKRIKQGRIR